MRRFTVLAILALLASLVPVQTALAATTRWVNDDAAAYVPPGTDCTTAGYATIQAAINASAAGDTINVCPGTYVETVLVNKANLKVLSTGGAGVTTVTPPASAHVVDIVAAGVTLKGFRILPLGTADPDIGVNLAVDGNAQAQILENIVISGRIGINLGCASDRSAVAFNTVDGQTEGGINIDTCEIAPFPGSDFNTVHHNTVCADTATGSIALGGNSNSNEIARNVARRISVFGFNNNVHHNVTLVPIVDSSGGNSVHDNTVDPTICAPPPPTTPTGTLVFECFDLLEGDDPNAPVRLTTKNFGTDAVIVRRALRMCEPALKSKIPGGEVDVFPGASMTFTLIDPSGGRHEIALDGAMAWHVGIGPNGEVAVGNPNESERAPLALVGLMLGGPDTMPIGDSFFDVFVDFMTPPNPVGPNALVEGRNATRGILDVPPFTAGGMADAFFDVFFDLTLMSDPSPAPGDERSIVLRPRTALALDGPLTHKPPTDGATFTSPSSAPIPLLDAAGAPTGWTMTPPTLSVAPTARATRVLECYRTEKGQDVNDPFSLETRNFGRDEVLVRNATVMCEGAIKSKTAVPSLAPPPLIWQCFNVANGDVAGDDFRITTNNFGDDRITVRKLAMLCEDAIKTRAIPGAPATSIGHASGRVFACYTIAGRPAQQPFLLTTRNFGPDNVRVTRPTLLCEPARKTPLPNFPGTEDTPLTGEPAGG